MDTPFTPKTHISKRIKIWAVILLIAIILASGLAMLTGGKTRLFKGQVGTTPTLSVTTDSAIPVSTIVSPGSPIEVIKLNITAKNSDITVNKIQIQAVSGKDNIEKISLVTGINPDNEIEMTPQTNPDYYAANPNINLTIKSTPGTYILIKVYIKKDAPANATVKFSIPFLTYIQTTPSDASITGSFPIESKNFTVEQITPKLTVGKPTPEISAGTIIPNKTADVAKFTISNNSNEDIKINSITITNAGNATIYDILGFTLTLLDEEDKNAYKPSIVLTNETQPAATTYIADLSNGLWIIPKDKTSKRLLITGHLKKEAKTGNTLQIGLLEKFSINAVGVTSGQKAEIIMSPEPLMGNIFTISAVEDASVQQAVAAAEKAAADAKKYAEDASAAFQSVKDLLASTDSTLKDLAIKVQQETSTADFAYVEATGAAMKAKNAKTSAEADAAKTEAENAAAKAKTASENAKKYADQALNPKPTLKELCQKGGHSQWYKWDEKKQTCTYQGTEYSTAEDLQNAINAGNQTVLQITCVNTIGAEWQPPNCKFNGNLYTNAENLNAAVEAAKQPEEQAPSDFENLCKKIGWGEWNSQTKKCKLTMDNKEYSDEAELKKGLKNFFK
ncbi:hypothetical protein HZC21_00405, partial [Candidatus Peregrinibacteria bacterium]|nr:hypothetical protein [Candidatus Peregrinibacteria bacterium]